MFIALLLAAVVTPEMEPSTAPKTKVVPTKKVAAAVSSAPKEGGKATEGIMLINPQDRATDYQQALMMIKGTQAAHKIFFRLADGTTISNIIEMTPIGSGSLILFKYNSNAGIKNRVVAIEDIEALLSN